MVAKAGFQGFNIDPETSFVPDAISCKEALDNAGLGCSICAFPASLEDVHGALDYCVNIDATALVINARIFPFSPEDAVEFVESTLELGRNEIARLRESVRAQALESACLGESDHGVHVSSAQ